MDYDFQAKIAKWFENPTVRVNVGHLRGFRLYRGILGGCFAYAMVMNQPFAGVHTHTNEYVEVKLLNRTLFEIREDSIKK